MKIWLKYILGCALGIVLSFILQSSNQAAVAVVQYLSDFSLSAGRYALLPLLFPRIAAWLRVMFIKKTDPAPDGDGGSERGENV